MFTLGWIYSYWTVRRAPCPHYVAAFKRAINSVTHIHSYTAVGWRHLVFSLVVVVKPGPFLIIINKNVTKYYGLKNLKVSPILYPVPVCFKWDVFTKWNKKRDTICLALSNITSSYYLRCFRRFFFIENNINYRQYQVSMCLNKLHYPGAILCFQTRTPTWIQ